MPQTEAAFHLNQGIIRPIVPLGKFLTGVLCVGSGHSMDREGPSVQIGAGMASAISQWFGLSPERVQSLVPVGAAAALAAAFNTPVAAVLFALEEIIGDMNAGLIGSTVVASITSVIIERSILGDEVLFRVPAYQLVHPAELAAYAALGVIGGLISLVFCKGLLSVRALFLRMPISTAIFQPAIGGLIIGIVLVFVPQVMGVGYEYVDQALNGGMLLRTMLLLCAVKLVATIISYASGNAGGIFAPSLYLGAMAGVVGMVVSRLPVPGCTHWSEWVHSCRYYPGTNDFRVHNFRAHAGLSDSGAANDCEYAQFCDLETLPAKTRIPRPTRTEPCSFAKRGNTTGWKNMACQGHHESRNSVH